LGPSGESIRLRPPDLDAQGRVVAHQLALERPPHDVLERDQPILRLVRCHGVDQRDNEFLRHRRQRKVTMLVTKFFEDRSTARGCAAGERAESLRAVIFGNGSGDGAGLAAFAGADGDGGGGERLLIRLHKFRRAHGPRKRNAGPPPSTEVVVSTKGLHVSQLQFGHCCPLPFGVAALSFAISASHRFGSTPADSPLEVMMIIFPLGSTSYRATSMPAFCTCLATLKSVGLRWLYCLFAVISHPLQQGHLWGFA